jgi:hypothetical protein
MKEDPGTTFAYCVVLHKKVMTLYFEVTLVLFNFSSPASFYGQDALGEEESR